MLCLCSFQLPCEKHYVVDLHVVLMVLRLVGARHIAALSSGKSDQPCSTHLRSKDGEKDSAQSMSSAPRGTVGSSQYYFSAFMVFCCSFWLQMPLLTIPYNTDDTVWLTSFVSAPRSFPVICVLPVFWSYITFYCFFSAWIFSSPNTLYALGLQPHFFVRWILFLVFFFNFRWVSSDYV